MRAPHELATEGVLRRPLPMASWLAQRWRALAVLLSAAAPGKDGSIETLRGIAIVLIVAGHVIGEDATRGLQVGRESWLRYFYYALSYLRIPLFTVISGYLYAARPVVSGAGYRTFLAAKARRLLWPFVTVSTLQYLVQAVTGSGTTTVALKDLWRIYLFPYAQFWFLPALLAIFALVGVADWRGWLRGPWQWAAWWIGAMAAFYAVDAVAAYLPMGARVPRLLPYFLLGYGLRRIGWLSARGTRLAALALFAATFALQQLAYVEGLRLTGPVVKLLSLSVAMPGMVLAFWWKRPVRLFAWLGQYAYGIYLFHVFGAVASRLVLRALGVHRLDALFAFGLLGGLVLPIVIEQGLRKRPQLSTFFLGTKPRPVAVS